jgi:hypothetical protein
MIIIEGFLAAELISAAHVRLEIEEKSTGIDQVSRDPSLLPG